MSTAPVRRTPVAHPPAGSPRRRQAEHPTTRQLAGFTRLRMLGVFHRMIFSCSEQIPIESTGS
jgi:hypothetical protein